MVEKPYYQAERTQKLKHRRYSELVAALNAEGEREADHLEAKYGYGPDQRSHYEILVGSWARGPLLYIEKRESDGTPTEPVIDNSLCKTIVWAGFVPWGFRPDRDDEEGETWMWYLRPISDLTDDDFPEIKYGLRKGEGGLVRTDDGDAVLFDTAEQALAVLSEDDNREVRKVVE